MKCKPAFAVFLVVLWILSLPTFTVSAQTPSVGVTPSSGYPGTVVIVSGSGFALSAPCDIAFGNFGTVTSTTTNPNNGDLTASFTIPDSAPEGPNPIQVNCPQTQQSASTSFTVIIPPTPTCEQLQNCTPTPVPATKTCQELQNCTPVPVASSTLLPNVSATPTSKISATATVTFTATVVATTENSINTPGSTPEPSDGGLWPPPLWLIGLLIVLLLAAGFGIGRISGRGKPSGGKEPDENWRRIAGGGANTETTDPTTGSNGLKPGEGSDPHAIGPKHDDLLTNGEGSDPHAIGPKHDDLVPGESSDPHAIGPKHDDLFPGESSDPHAIGPKHDDLFPGESSDPHVIGPKHDDLFPGESGDPHAIGPKHDDLLTNGEGENVGGDPGNPSLKPSGTPRTSGSVSPGGDGGIRPGSGGDPHSTVRGPSSPGSGGGDDLPG